MANSEHSVKININGNASSAVGEISRVKIILNGVKTVASSGFPPRICIPQTACKSIEEFKSHTKAIYTFPQ